MSTNQMDYFDQKPDLDLKPFFEGKGLKLDGPVPVSGAGAPPPKDTYWVATPQNDEPEQE
ncbi:MAG: hypothetical protein ACLGJB_25825 [Blastocatellia bacterium]|jgi:hypothetical protein